MLKKSISIENSIIKSNNHIPTNINHNVFENNVNLSWNSEASNNINKYEVNYKLCNSNEYTTKLVKNNIIVLSNLEYESTYEIFVISIDEHNCKSEPSLVVTIKTDIFVSSCPYIHTMFVDALISNAESIILYNNNVNTMYLRFAALCKKNDNWDLTWGGLIHDDYSLTNSNYLKDIIVLGIQKGYHFIISFDVDSSITEALVDVDTHNLLELYKLMLNNYKDLFVGISWTLKGEFANNKNIVTKLTYVICNLRNLYPKFIYCLSLFVQGSKTLIGYSTDAINIIKEFDYNKIMFNCYMLIFTGCNDPIVDNDLPENTNVLTAGIIASTKAVNKTLLDTYYNKHNMYNYICVCTTFGNNKNGIKWYAADQQYLNLLLFINKMGTTLCGFSKEKDIMPEIYKEQWIPGIFGKTISNYIQYK